MHACASGAATNPTPSPLAQVPIVEPEILLDGDHDIDRTLEVSVEECMCGRVLDRLGPVFQARHTQ